MPKGHQQWKTVQEIVQADMHFGANDEHRVAAGGAFELDLVEDPVNEQFTKYHTNGTKAKDAPNSITSCCS